MAYCIYSDINALTDITSTDVANDDITILIAYATIELNRQINVKIIEEPVKYIDKYRQNDIDGSNTTFYVNSSYKWYLGDLDNDGDVDTSDAIVYEYDATSETKSTCTVSSIDEEGKFVLSSAPSSGNRLFVTYARAPVSENGSSCDNLLKQACINLTASLCYTKIQARDFKTVSLGDLKVMHKPQAFSMYFDRYEKLLQTLQTRIAIEEKSKESAQTFAPVLY